MKENRIMKMRKLNIAEIKSQNIYSDELTRFCKENDIRLLSLNTNIGKCIALLSQHPNTYVDGREHVIKILEKLEIKSNDPIQVFNKFQQYGLKSNSDDCCKGKYYIIYPYEKSNKQAMRKIELCESNKEEQIDKIKKDIEENYMEVPNRLWQIGHKNPGLEDNTSSNLVYQPPIQGRYRDNYIFIDSITRYPLAKKLNHLLENEEIKLTKRQIEDYIEVLSKHLDKAIS